MRAFCPECGTTVPVGGTGLCHLGHGLQSGPARVGATRAASAARAGSAQDDRGGEPELWVADLGPAEADPADPAPQPEGAVGPVPALPEAGDFDELSSAFDDLSDGFDLEGLEELVSAMTELGLESDGSATADLFDDAPLDEARLDDYPLDDAPLQRRAEATVTAYDDLFAVQEVDHAPQPWETPLVGPRPGAEAAPLPPPATAERLDPTEPDIAVWAIGAADVGDDVHPEVHGELPEETPAPVLDQLPPPPDAAHGHDGPDEPSARSDELAADDLRANGENAMAALEALEELWGDALGPEPAESGPDSAAAARDSAPPSEAHAEPVWEPPSGRPIDQLMPPASEEPEPERPEKSVATAAMVAGQPVVPQLDLRSFTARPTRGRFRRR